MKLKNLLFVGVPALVFSSLLASCSLHPGGLSDAEWNSLSPARRAELTMQQQALSERQYHDMQQNEHWKKEDQNSSNDYWQREAKKDAHKAMKGYKPAHTTTSSSNKSVGQQLRDAGM